MGDGEIIGTAVEGAMNVRAHRRPHQGRETPWPRIENDDWMMSVGAGARSKTPPASPSRT
jgi:acetamidase/formamidase